MASHSSSNSRSLRSNSNELPHHFSTVPVVGPNCRCGFTTIVCVVKKEGPNKGRKFWGCRNYGVPNLGCSYMMWYEDWCPNVVTNEECLSCREKDVDLREKDMELREKEMELREKEMELISLRKALVEMHGHHKSTKDQMNILVVTCLLLGVICSMVIYMFTTKN